MRKSIAAALIAASAAISACGQNRSENGGPTVAKNYQVGNFDQVEVGGPFNVEVRTGANPSVSARGPQKMLEHMVVEVKGGKLVIRQERQKGCSTPAGISAARSTSRSPSRCCAARPLAGRATSRSTRSRVTRSTARSPVRAASTSPSSTSRRSSSSVAGSGAAQALAGRAQSASFDIAGSGDIDAKGVQAQTADVSIAGSGNVAANASNTASVSIMGSGDVDVSGGAKCSVSKAGSGNVTCS